MKKGILLFFIVKMVAILIIKYLSYIGDTSPEINHIILTYFTMEDIQKGEEYSRKGFEIGLVSGILDFLFIYLFVFRGFSSKLEDALVMFTKNHFFLTSIYFISLLFTLDFLLELPFSIYFEYLLEKEFGFSNLTPGAFFLFTLKNYLLGLFSTLFIGIGCLYILKFFIKTWYFIIPIVSVLLGLLISIIFPILITPLYYETAEIEEGSLKSKIFLLCQKEDISLSQIYIIKESEYSNHTNAYFTGWGSERKIFLYDTLLQNHSEEEIISVLGHEIGHWKHNHQIKDIFLEAFLLFLGCFLMNGIFSLSRKEGSLFLKEIFNPSSLPFIILIFGLLHFLVRPIENGMSRLDETQADNEALLITKDVESFISTEIKMARDNKSRLNPHPFVVFLYFSHPKTIDRILLAEEFRKK
jgi:STE24 endopeptidase